MASELRGSCMTSTSVRPTAGRAEPRRRYRPERLRALWECAVHRAYVPDGPMATARFAQMHDDRVDFALLERAALLLVDDREVLAIEQISAAEPDAQALVAVRAMTLMHRAGCSAHTARATPPDFLDCRGVIRAWLAIPADPAIAFCAQLIARFGTRETALAATYEYADLQADTYGRHAAADLLGADIAQLLRC